MTDTILFRLLDGVNRPSRLSDAVEELCEEFATLLLERQNYLHFMVQPTGVVSTVGGSLPASTASRASLR